VTVTNPDGQSDSLPRSFTFYGPPMASKVTPPKGPIAGGTQVEIACEGVQPGVQVEFGGVPLVEVRPMGQYLIAGRTGARAEEGPVDVVMINPDGQRGTLKNGFTYEGAPAPVVTKVSPANGPAAGGTNVQINCETLQPGVRVEFGGSPLADVTPSGKFLLTGRTTAHASGPVDVVLINPDGKRGTLEKGFTYDAAPAPVVTKVSPDQGSASGGTPVQISCENFQPGVRVEFGGAPLQDVAPLGKFMLTGRTSPHEAGPVDIVLINPDGQTAKLSSAFIYR
jgi:predicted cupin superfamily sugar epimerase